MNIHVRHMMVFLLLVFLTGAPAPRTAGGVTASYLYNLSNFTGTVPYNWATLAVDKGNNEVYAVSNGAVTIFNERGMETYQFGNDSDIGAVADVAVEESGNIIILSYKGYTSALTLCNFRGEPLAPIELKNLPPELAGFMPNRMRYRSGFLYLVSLAAMRVVVTDVHGNFKDVFDVSALIGLEEHERADTGIVGFNIDREGNLLVTVPAIARAYVISQERTVRSFGRRGSAPGRFGIPAGIAEDPSGNYLVSDTLRCVIMAFDRDFRFLAEFGYRGPQPGNLVGPRDLAVDSESRVYVSQLKRRGISVYQIQAN